MEFHLAPNNVGQPDEELLADLRRVMALVVPNPLTKERYDEHGRWCSATMRKRFGNWNVALEKAGIRPSKRMRIPKDELLSDLKKAAKLAGERGVTRERYDEHGKFSAPALSRAFGSWNGALRAAGLPVVFEPKPISQERCFKSIETVWRRLGRQPHRDEVKRPEAEVTGKLIVRRFGSWRRALEAFVRVANSGGLRDDAPIEKKASKPQSGSRSEPTTGIARGVGWRLRFLVMRRDRFTCLKCGRSPANHPGLALVIDHKVPWSKGGLTTFENLHTLCEQCNGGRGNLDLEL